MTNNIEKLYELAGVVKYRAVNRYNPLLKYGDYNNLDDVLKFSDDFDIELEYPPFTDTKQLEIIKCLATKFILGNFKGIDNGLYNFNLTIASPTQNKHILCEHKEYDQALAGLVCELWKDLTDTQRGEVRKVLE